MTKAYVVSVAHFEAFTERLGAHGEMRTAIVESRAPDRRVIDWPGGIPEVAAPAEWS